MAANLRHVGGRGLFRSCAVPQRLQPRRWQLGQPVHGRPSPGHFARYQQLPRKFYFIRTRRSVCPTR